MPGLLNAVLTGAEDHEFPSAGSDSIPTTIGGGNVGANAGHKNTSFFNVLHERHSNRSIAEKMRVDVFKRNGLPTDGDDLNEWMQKLHEFQKDCFLEDDREACTVNQFQTCHEFFCVEKLQSVNFIVAISD